MAFAGVEPAPAAGAPAARPLKGDCVDCMACVNVCPMGIDIRNGQQMECITCGLCIDACDDVMGKLGLPRGLIDYFTLEDEREGARGRAGQEHLEAHLPAPDDPLHLAVVGDRGGRWWSRSSSGPRSTSTVSPIRNPVYVTQSDGTIRNAYDLRLRNKHHEPRDFALSFTADAPLNLHVGGDRGDRRRPCPPTRPPRCGSTSTRRRGRRRPRRSARDVRLWVTDISNGDRAERRDPLQRKGRLT